MRAIPTLIVMVSIALSSGPTSADARADALVAQARKALGGDTLQAVKSLSAAGKIRRSAGETDMTGELQIDVQLPDKMLRTEHMSVMNGAATVTRETGFNGDRPLEHTKTAGGAHGQVMIRAPQSERPEADQVRTARQEFGRLFVAWLLAAPAPGAFSFTYAGEAESPDGRADVLEVKGPDDLTARLFLDQQTHRPLMLVYQGPEPRMRVATMRAESREQAGHLAREAAVSGEPRIVEIQMFFDEYRSVDGVSLPHRISREVGGKVAEEWEITRYRVNPSIDPAKFEKKN